MYMFLCCVIIFVVVLPIQRQICIYVTFSPGSYGANAEQISSVYSRIMDTLKFFLVVLFVEWCIGPTTVLSSCGRSLLSLSGVPLADFQCPLRPNHGTEGQTIQLRANHFQVRIPRGLIHHYDVSIQPDKCPRRVNRYQYFCCDQLHF